MIRETLRHRQSGKFFFENEGGVWLCDEPLLLYSVGEAKANTKEEYEYIDEMTGLEFTGADLEVVKLEIKIID